jgi:transcriptional regulator with PAS, ATPase and Fis domain
MFKVVSEQLGFILTQSSHNIGNIKETHSDAAKKLPKAAKPPGFEEIIGSSKAIEDTIEKAAAVAQYEFPILLLGETGTGKELFAKAIHRSSFVSNGPFIVVNSAAIPNNLLESELFGYKEGAFTGGLKGGKRGKILLANGGTLFLDEIGELSLDLQAKLLRVIQEQEVEPLGSEKPIHIKVRIISATHRNLEEMVKNQQFREDLYYRLNSIEIKIPPLRDRGEDIIELAESMLEDLAKRSGKRMKRLSAETRQALLDYDYPGNIRELQNIINWAFVFADDEVIKIEDLTPAVQKYARKNPEMSEKEELTRLLREFKGNKTALAKYLGITRTGLWKKLKRLGLQEGKSHH